MIDSHAFFLFWKLLILLKTITTSARMTFMIYDEEQYQQSAW